MNEGDIVAILTTISTAVLKGVEYVFKRKVKTNEDKTKLAEKKIEEGTIQRKETLDESTAMRKELRDELVQLRSRMDKMEVDAQARITKAEAAAEKAEATTDLWRNRYYEMKDLYSDQLILNKKLEAEQRRLDAEQRRLRAEVRQLSVLADKEGIQELKSRIKDWVDMENRQAADAVPPATDQS